MSVHVITSSELSKNWCHSYFTYNIRQTSLQGINCLTLFTIFQTHYKLNKGNHHDQICNLSKKQFYYACFFNQHHETDKRCIHYNYSKGRNFSRCVNTVIFRGGAYSDLQINDLRKCMSLWWWSSKRSAHYLFLCFEHWTCWTNV